MSQPFFTGHQPHQGARTGQAGVVGPTTSTVVAAGVVGVMSPQAEQKATALAKVVEEHATQGTREEIAKQRQARMTQGMQAAALGKSIEDIEAEQPWYSKIFGKNDLVAGAEAYERATMADKVLQSIHNNMDELRKLSPEQARHAFAGYLEAAKTGRPDVDLEVQQKLTMQLPRLFDQQAKQHYAYRQELMSDQQMKATYQAAETLGAQVRTLSLDPTSRSGNHDTAIAVAEFDLNVAKLDGQDEGIYQQNKIKAFSHLVDQIGEPEVTMNPDGSTTTTYRGGHAVMAILAASQEFRKLPPEVQSDLRDKAETAMHRANTKFALPFMEQRAKLQAKINDPRPGYNVRQMVREMQDIDREMQRVSGSFVPSYDSQDYERNSARLAGEITQRRRREEEKRLAEMLKLREGQDEAAKERQNMEILAAAYSQNPVAVLQAVHAGGAKMSDLDKALNNKYRFLSPEEKVQLLRGSPRIIKSAEVERQGIMDVLFNKTAEDFQKSDTDVAALLASYENDLKQLGEDKTKEYWGTERAKILQDMSEGAKRGMPPHILMARAWNDRQQPRSVVKANEEVKKLADKEIERQMKVGTLGLFFDSRKSNKALVGKDIRVETMRAARQDIADEMARLLQLDRSRSPESVAAEAINNVMQDPSTRRYDELGGYVTERLYRDQPSIQEQLTHPGNGKKGIPPDVVRDVIDEIVEANTPEGASAVYPISQYSGGAPQLVLRIDTEYGARSTFKYLTLDDIREFYHNRKQSKRVASDKRATAIQDAIRGGSGYTPANIFIRK